MSSPRILGDEWAVESRLRELFDASKSDFLPIIREVIGARADYVPENDAVTTAGQFMYIHGVRNLRAFFRGRGWLRWRERNVELVRHPDLTLMVGYQTVDLAAVSEHLPQAISGKGSGSRKVFDSAQLSLFEPGGLEEHEQSAPPTKSGLWYLCVSAIGDDIRAEISLFGAIRNSNFASCRERIFLVKEGDWGDMALSDDDRGIDDAVQVEPIVRRK